jgi:hypothetical protein
MLQHSSSAGQEQTLVSLFLIEDPPRLQKWRCLGRRYPVFLHVNLLREKEASAARMQATPFRGLLLDLT